MKSSMASILFVLFFLLSLVQGRFVVEKNSITVLSPHKLRGKRDGAIGNFGVPDYGGYILGSLVYPDKAASHGCQVFQGDKPFKFQSNRPTIVLLDRGECFFALKVWHAQQAGAAAVIVADTIEESLITMDSPEESTDADGYIEKIVIPSALVDKSFGDTLKEALNNKDEVLLRIDWRESVPHPDNRVEYELWTNSNDECGARCDEQMNFVKNFKGHAQILERGGYTLFTPHYITWFCPKPFVESSQCKSQCINRGRYCAPDPEKDFGEGYEGKDVVYENLRQLCVHRVANESNRSWVWWDYVTDFHVRCSMKEKKYSKDCAEGVMKSLDLPIEKIMKCVGDPEADEENEVLRNEQVSQIGRGSRGDVTILPTLVLNNVQYRGKLERTSVLKAVCARFKETTEPPVCLSGDIETNECLERNGGCWQDKNANVTACKDTFRGRVCECPVVNGVQYRGDGYTTCEGCEEKVEIKTAEVSNILDMMRSVSVYDTGGGSNNANTSRADWKLKQDSEEFRVMYREGPEGTPFHTLLVEGYVDGPVDVGLCLTWESPLYKKWWPQFTIPSFKVTASECLQKIQTGEQMSLVRMKPPWPLSTREAIVHYYLFEYFQDDLIIVLLKTVHDSKSVNASIDGVNNDAIPEAKDVVRIDVVGGYVLQKVTSERSYFRAIANLDIKLDFVPPSLINFMSRQLIGSGFRLYQKAVASKMNNEKEFSKALGDPLYVKIREALYNNINGSSNVVMDDEEVLKQVATILLPAEEDNGEAISKADSEEIVVIEKGNCEIVQDVKKIMHDIPIHIDQEDDSSVCMRSDVKEALGTLERAISMVRKFGFHSRRFSFTFANNVETRYITEKSATFDNSYSCVKNEVCGDDDVSRSSITLQETSEEDLLYEIQNFRQTGTNPNSKEVNYNKVVPTSPEEKNHLRSIEASSHVDSYSLTNNERIITCDDNKQLNIDDAGEEDMSLDVSKQLSKRKKYRRYCCFLI